MMKYILIALLIFSTTACNSIPKQKFDYIPLSSFNNDTSLITTGTPVKLLAFSGTKENDKENIYYSQILVIAKNSSDTFSILCPLLKIPYTGGESNTIYITPLEYNPEKRILDATYERKDSSTDILLQVLGDVSENENLTTETTNYSKNENLKKELVAVNKTIPIFQRRYPTIIGILSFNEDPH